MKLNISEGMFTSNDVIAAEHDPIWLVENEKLSIKTKAGELIPFILNSIQKKIIAKIRELQAEGKPIRIWILKARQMGCSTLIEAIIYAYTSQKQNINSLILADDLDGSNYLFNMSKLYHEQVAKEFKHPLQRSNEKKIEFEGRHSQILVDTADNLDAGRKYTFQIAHLSEVAFFRDARTLMIGLNQAIPELPNTIAIGETTANGVGGYFYEQWKKAKAGETDWTPLFFAWFEDDTYQSDLPDGFELTKEESAIQTKHGLTLRQMSWRRDCIKNKCDGSVDIFNQEYPATDEEAFLVSGRCRFNTDCLKIIRNTTVNEGEESVLEDVYGTVIVTPHPTGWLKIWKKVEESHSYIIGSDTSEGIENKTASGKEHDYSTAEVLDLDTLEQVAEIKCHLEPDVFAEELRRLGVYYNKAMIGVERNHPGYGVLLELRKKYKNIYYMEIFEEATQTRKKKLGWLTDPKTKPLMVGEGDRIIREGLATIHSPELLSELMTFVRLADGKTEAQEGCFDDLVIAWLIALQIRKYAPRKATTKESRQRSMRNKLQDKQMESLRGY